MGENISNLKTDLNKTLHLTETSNTAVRDMDINFNIINDYIAHSRAISGKLFKVPYIILYTLGQVFSSKLNHKTCNLSISMPKLTKHEFQSGEELFRDKNPVILRSFDTT